MTASDLVLGKGQVLVKQANSLYGITDTTEGYLFGEIVLVNDLSDKSQVTQVILFNPEAAISSFKISSIQYWIILEDLISINEGVTPP